MQVIVVPDDRLDSDGLESVARQMVVLIGKSPGNSATLYHVKQISTVSRHCSSMMSRVRP